jgi:CubicO group peptidase (beta-lactamase class C family)
MNPRSFILGAVLALLGSCAQVLAPALRADEPPATADLAQMLEAIRKEHDLPGLAAAVVRGDRVVAEGVAGVRHLGQVAKITLQDRFQLGSCSKPMTALMILRLIAAGKLSFDTTLAEALPDLPMNEAYGKVTLAQLLTFTGGIQPYTLIGPKLTPILFELKGSASQQFVKHVLKEDPVARPGTARKYSNASYAVAALVAARRAERTWEALMEGEVFKPLGLRAAGFGRPRTKERPNEPTFHIKGAAGYKPEPADRPALPAVALAGAGGIHCSIRDFARFASYELAAARGKDTLLAPATARRWQELRQAKEGMPFFGGTPALTAAYVLWPSKNLAAVMAVNAGGAGEACTAFFKSVEKRYGSAKK